MAEQKKTTSWRKRFLANRMSFESLLSEKELVFSGPERKNSGLPTLLAIFLFHSLLLTQAVLRGGGALPRSDAVAVETAYKYSKALDSGSYSQLFKPENFSVSRFTPPLYYLSFYIPLKLFPSNPALALAAVNSFYLLLIMLFLFFAVRKARNSPSAWFAASLAASFPAVISLGRHASPDIALMAFIAGVYCCYINSEGFEIRKWSILFGICFTLGLLSDARILIYALPLMPFALNAFLNPLTRKNITPFYLLLILVPLPWYFRSFVFSFFHDLFVRNDFREAVGIGSVSPLNILRDLPLLVDYLHLPLFCLCFISMVWLGLSVYMAYEDKELIFIWFLLPYCVFSLFSGDGAGNIRFSVLPFAIAAGIMMPNRVRKALIVLTLLLAVIYQSGFVHEAAAVVSGRRIGLFGMDLVRGADVKTEDALKAIYDASGGRDVKVQIVGDDDYFNTDSIGISARELGYHGINFVRYPRAFMGLADFVMYKTDCFAAAYRSGVFKEYSEVISAPGGWFSSVFSPLVVFDRADTSRLFVFTKSRARPAPLAPGRYAFPRFSIGAVTFEDVIADVGPFNENSGTYKSLEIFVPHFKFQEVDLYSMRFRVGGLSMLPVSGSFSDVRLTGCDSVRILLLKLREEGLGRILAASDPDFKNLSVRLDNGLSILGTYHNFGIDLGFSVTPTGAGFKLKLARMYLGSLGLEVKEEADMPEQAGADTETANRSGDEMEAVSPEPRDTAKLQKDIAQFSNDPVVAESLKITGYGKLLDRVSGSAKAGAPGENMPKRGTHVPAAGRNGSLSSILVRLFSMDFDLLNEKDVPFKVQVSEISLKNGLLTVH